MDLSDVRNESYDLCMFASGYEDRCTNVPELLQGCNLGEIHVFGFSDFRDLESRRLHDLYFTQEWNTPPTLMSPDDGSPLYEYLNRISPVEHSHLRILLDYSSMSRIWYATAFNWFRLTSHFSSIDVDLIYSIGRYDDREYPPTVVRDIMSIPGCEGRLSGGNPLAVIFGLGFDGSGPLSLLERMEPNVVEAFVASPGASDWHVKQALMANDEIIRSFSTSGRAYNLPLNSLSTSFQYLSEIVSYYRRDYDVAIVPMGPKPLGVASILVSLKLPDVACLRVAGDRPGPEVVKATGDVLVSRIMWRN